MKSKSLFDRVKFPGPTIPYESISNAKDIDKFRVTIEIHFNSHQHERILPSITISTFDIPGECLYDKFLYGESSVRYKITNIMIENSIKWANKFIFTVDPEQTTKRQQQLLFNILKYDYEHKARKYGTWRLIKKSPVKIAFVITKEELLEKRSFDIDTPTSILKELIGNCYTYAQLKFGERSVKAFTATATGGYNIRKTTDKITEEEIEFRVPPPVLRPRGLLEPILWLYNIHIINMKACPKIFFLFLGVL